MSDRQDLDRMIAQAARESAADSFGPYFAERAVRAARDSGSARAGGVLRGWLRPALALTTVLIVLGVADWTRVHRIAAPAGGTESISFADGTEVELAPVSSIEWKRFALRSERSVRLNGEAYFTVASDGRPFSVETFNSRVQVTGTRFNVRAWDGGPHPQTLVSLDEGGVRVEPAAGPQVERIEGLSASPAAPVELIPGQTVRVSAGRIIPESRFTTSEASAWREGGLTLVEAPLSEILDELERRFGITLEADPSLLGRLATYVDPRVETAEDVLDAVCFALNLSYRPILGGFRIESNP